MNWKEFVPVPANENDRGISVFADFSMVRPHKLRFHLRIHRLRLRKEQKSFTEVVNRHSVENKECLIYAIETIITSARKVISG